MAQSNDLKRPHPKDEVEGAQKRVRSPCASPAPQQNGASGNTKLDIDEIITAARAKAAALAAERQGTQPVPAAPAHSTTSLQVQNRIAQLRARVAEAQQKSMMSLPQPVSPTLPEDGISRARGGLDVGLHPALMDSSQDPRSSRGRPTMRPKFATTMANQRKGSPLVSNQAKENPYFNPSLGPQIPSTRGRVRRQLIFNQKGKYIQQAAALRRLAALEAMKKRIAEQSRKTGMIDDIEIEKAFLVPRPPEIEWWDEGLLAGTGYAELLEGLKIDTEDSVVTVYIQHPVAIEPSQERTALSSKPVHLTPKEQKKLRRQRRKEKLQEQQMKVRLGLEPAAPPKVKRSNLVRVLGEEAVADPTVIEARVNREIVERAQKHINENEKRKLTKEQRRERLATQQASDAAKGIFCSVYRIESLANGQHRFKISKNAEQNALTGICILQSKFCLVVVEGGQHSIKSYKKLMLNRINWTENSGNNSEGNQEDLAAWLQAEDENGKMKDLSTNTCRLIWGGVQKVRGFKKWVPVSVKPIRMSLTSCEEPKWTVFGLLLRVYHSSSREHRFLFEKIPAQ